MQISPYFLQFYIVILSVFRWPVPGYLRVNIDVYIRMQMIWIMRRGQMKAARILQGEVSVLSQVRNGLLAEIVVRPTFVTDQARIRAGSSGLKIALVKRMSAGISHSKGFSPLAWHGSSRRTTTKSVCLPLGFHSNHIYIFIFVYLYFLSFFWMEYWIVQRESEFCK